MLERGSLRILEKALTKLDGGFASLPAIEHELDGERIEEVMLRAAEIMQDNYPYFHPYYAGQMLKPPHPVARLAYMLSLWINPNNHALDGGGRVHGSKKRLLPRSQDYSAGIGIWGT